MPVEEMDPHRRPCRRPSRAPPAVPWRPGRPSCKYVAPHWGTWLPNAALQTIPSHSESACDPPETVAPSPPYTPWTAPVPSASPGMKSPIVSSVFHTPPPTSFPPPGTGGRIFQMSSQNWYSGPPHQTVLTGGWNPPEAIYVPMTLPCHIPCRRENFGLYVSDDDIYPK